MTFTLSTSCHDDRLHAHDPLTPRSELVQLSVHKRPEIRDLATGRLQHVAGA